MKNNRLRELFDGNKPSLGTHFIIPWPGIIEVIAHSGVFDYVEYVGEDSPFSIELMDNFGRAIELFPSMSMMMKIEEHSKGLIATRAIDAGIQNVLFTDCRTAQDVVECVRIVRPETPELKGSHGGGFRRNVGYVLEGCSDAWVNAMNDVVIGIMIEKRESMDNLDDILSVPGIDFVQFGPGDYSITVGQAGKKGSSEIQNIQIEMIERALAKGVHPRVEIASFDQASHFIAMGVRHFCIGWDVAVLHNWCKEQGAAMNELLSSA